MAVTKRLRYEILRRDEFKCRYCGLKADETELVVDHVVPSALGGPDSASNLVAACRPCNAGKAAVRPDEDLVEDVSQKALHWAEAMALATKEVETRLEEREKVTGYFDDEWFFRNEIPQYQAWKFNLPDDWEATVWRFYSLGIQGRLLDDAIDIAHHSQAYDKFSYFCGVCWNKIRDLQERALEIVSEADDGA